MLNRGWAILPRKNPRTMFQGKKSRMDSLSSKSEKGEKNHPVALENLQARSSMKLKTRMNNIHQWEKVQCWFNKWIETVRVSQKLKPTKFPQANGPKENAICCVWQWAYCAVNLMIKDQDTNLIEFSSHVTVTTEKALIVLFSCPSDRHNWLSFPLCK